MKILFLRMAVVAMMMAAGLNVAAQNDEKDDNNQSAQNIQSEQNAQIDENGQSVRTTTEREWNTLIRALIYCESKGNPKAKNGPYVGVLQMSPICVRGINQIGVKKFSYNDRKSHEKSIEMFNIFMDRYNPTHDIEKAIRMWSGGVRYSVKKTQKNYNKVIGVYNRMLAESEEEQAETQSEGKEE